MKKSKKGNQYCNVPFHCRFTETEFRRIKEESTNLGLSQAEYVRQVISGRKSHTLIDARDLVKWLDEVAIEYKSANRALCSFIGEPLKEIISEYHSIELYNLIVNCIAAQENVEKAMLMLMRLISK